MATAVDENLWVPQFDPRKEGDIITPVTQADNSVRYFLGNYDEAGEIDRVRVTEHGKYKNPPGVQMVDENGDDIAGNGGAVFQVLLNKKGGVLSVKCPRDKEGSGFTKDLYAARFVEKNAGDEIEAGSLEVAIKSGQWLDNYTAKDVDDHNSRITTHQNAEVRNATPQTQGQIIGTTDASGQPGGYVHKT